MLREVELNEISGRLFLSRMPGREGPFDAESELIRAKGIETVYSLTDLAEVEKKSPDYAEAIKNQTLPWERVEFPIIDYGVPSDHSGFLALARNIASKLRDGENVLIHCGAGVGRTGTLAASTLIALGLDRSEALARVSRAGSGPERSKQSELVAWVGDQNR